MMKISIIQGNEKIPFGVKLRSRELNLVLRETAMTIRQEGRSRKISARISKFLCQIMKGQSKVIVQVIFHNNGDLKNSSK